MNPFNSLCLAEFEKYKKKTFPLFFFSYEWLLRNYNQFIKILIFNFKVDMIGNSMGIPP